MNHNFVLNLLSFPAKNSEEGYALLYTSLKGMLAVGKGEDRFSLYCDRVSQLQEVVIANGYTFREFLESLSAKGEEDLLLALLEIDDKTPMLDHLSDEELEEIAGTSFYFPDEEYQGSVDILAVAWRADGTLLSIATERKWTLSEIAFAQYVGGKTTGVCYVRNVSCHQHGLEINAQYGAIERTNLVELYPNCIFSAEFLEWHESLAADLKSRVAEKLSLAYRKNFQGGEPLFKTLDNAGGMREIRFSAVQGGAVRILFGALQKSKQAILVGFVKKSDNEGYTAAISKGSTLWDAIAKAVQ
jgi:hypothetical protein